MRAYVSPTRSGPEGSSRNEFRPGRCPVFHAQSRRPDRGTPPAQGLSAAARRALMDDTPLPADDTAAGEALMPGLDLPQTAPDPELVEPSLRRD